MSIPRLIVIVLMTLMAQPWAIGAIKCATQDARDAEAESSVLSSWEAVYRAFRRYGHCDDGAISEGYSESIGRLLSSEWARVGRLDQLSKRDSQFRRFVLRHIDETVPSSYLKRIESNAQGRCPSEASLLCQQILSKVRER
jgi:hypothetical protein